MVLDWVYNRITMKLYVDGTDGLVSPQRKIKTRNVAEQDRNDGFVRIKLYDDSS